MFAENSLATKQSSPTVFVIEDDAAARDAMRELLQPGGLVVRAYESAESFLEDFNSNPDGPACLLVDERLPGMKGSDLVRQLAQRGVRTPTVFVTGHATTPLTVDVMRNGAAIVLDKPCPETALWDAVRSALDADAQRIAQEGPREEARRRLEALSDSERRVLQMVLDGTPNKQIASRLGVCVRTVESRRSKIYQTTKVSSVAELVKLCVAAGMVEV